MTPEQFAEMYAINLYNQDQLVKVAVGGKRVPWHELTKKERNKWRDVADNILEEI